MNLGSVSSIKLLEFYLPDWVVINFNLHSGNNPDQIVSHHSMCGSETIAEKTGHPYMIQCSFLQTQKQFLRTHTISKSL